jgi:hypothetical protein
LKEVTKIHSKFTFPQKSEREQLLVEHLTIPMASNSVPKTCKVITAETIAKNLLEEVRQTLATIQESGSREPTLAAFLANGDPAAVKYAEWSKKTCEEK